jgi:hypothetical protein
MAYYWLDKFPEEKIEELSNLCKKAELLEEECSSPDRQWSSEGQGLINQDLQLIRYSPRREAKLLVQSNTNLSLEDEEFKSFFRKITKLAGVNYFYHGAILDSSKKLDARVLD